MWELDCNEGWALKNWCFWIVVLEKNPWESLGQQGDLPIGNQLWIFIGRNDAEAEAPILCPPDWKNWIIGKKRKNRCWERLKAWGKGDDKGWDGWMASLTRWTWVWANSRKWWRTEKPGLPQSMGLQRVGHDWGTEQSKPGLLCSPSAHSAFLGW